MKVICIKKPYYFWPFTLHVIYEIKKKDNSEKYYTINDNGIEEIIPNLSDYSEFLQPLDDYRQMQLDKLLDYDTSFNG